MHTHYRVENKRRSIVSDGSIVHLVRLKRIYQLIFYAEVVQAHISKLKSLQVIMGKFKKYINVERHHVIKKKYLLKNTSQNPACILITESKTSVDPS